MSATNSRFTASAILLVWGIILVYFQLSGRITSYLHPDFHIPTFVAGIVLLAISGALLFTFQTAGPSQANDCGSRHPFGGGILAIALLLAPLLCSVWISQGRYSANTVMNRGIVTDSAQLPTFFSPVDPDLPGESGTPVDGSIMDPSLYLKKNAEGYIIAETVDLLYGASEEGMRADFENKDVEVKGQFISMRTGNPNGDRFQLMRLFVMCCAADARPVAITVQAKSGTQFPEMTWVKVLGKATFPVEGGRHIAVIEASAISETEPPAESFNY
jgi:uncharacterized repeat protein (TIGR03943 family)